MNNGKQPSYAEMTADQLGSQLEIALSLLKSSTEESKAQLESMGEEAVKRLHLLEEMQKAKEKPFPLVFRIRASDIPRTGITSSNAFMPDGMGMGMLNSLKSHLSHLLAPFNKATLVIGSVLNNEVVQKAFSDSGIVHYQMAGVEPVLIVTADGEASVVIEKIEKQTTVNITQPQPFLINPPPFPGFPQPLFGAPYAGGNGPIGGFGHGPCMSGRPGPTYSGGVWTTMDEFKVFEEGFRINQLPAGSPSAREGYTHSIVLNQLTEWVETDIQLVPALTHRMTGGDLGIAWPADTVGSFQQFIKRMIDFAASLPSADDNDLKRQLEKQFFILLIPGVGTGAQISLVRLDKNFACY